MLCAFACYTRYIRTLSPWVVSLSFSYDRRMYCTRPLKSGLCYNESRRRVLSIHTVCVGGQRVRGASSFSCMLAVIAVLKGASKPFAERLKDEFDFPPNKILLY